jgi:hypothetical protein
MIRTKYLRIIAMPYWHDATRSVIMIPVSKESRTVEM